MHTLGRDARRLAFISIFAAAMLCIGPVVGSAAAAPRTTTTSVVASPDVIGTSGSSTLTATVTYTAASPATGSVTFLDTTNNVVLGTAPLSHPCATSVKRCTAQLVVGAALLSPGQNEIRASYSGDGDSKPSSGRTFMYTPQTPNGQTQCGPGETCDASGTSQDGTLAYSLDTGPSNNPGGQTLVISFSTQPLSCTTANTGDIAAFSVSDPTVSQRIEMNTLGAAGAAAQAAHPIAAGGAGGYVCLAQTTPFTTASGAQSPLEPDGFYEGVLAPCVLAADGSPLNAPCYDGGAYISSPAPDYRTFVLLTPGADPHLSH